MGKWPWGRAEFTAGPPELGQETQGLGTMQERASRPRWQPPLWECRSQQVCRGLFLAKNAAVGKGSQPLSGDPRRPGAPEGRRQGWGGDSCLLSLRPVGQNRDQKGPWEQLGRKARIPAPVPSQPRRRTPTRHLDKVLLLPPPACPPPHQAARGRCPPPPRPVHSPRLQQTSQERQEKPEWGVPSGPSNRHPLQGAQAAQSQECDKHRTEPRVEVWGTCPGLAALGRVLCDPGPGQSG